jgi:diguanylate cyclase (GGDEF)-like protein
MHFPGAFCSYDAESGTLFSSDIFGAFTERFQLYAEDATEYFEAMRPFHTHYMPSRYIVNHGLDAIEAMGRIERIAPQHGSIIPHALVGPVIERLRRLKCGIYLEYGGLEDVGFLSRFDALLSQLYEISAYFESFESDTRRIVSMLDGTLPLRGIRAFVLTEEGRCVDLASEETCLLRRGDPRIRRIFEERMRLWGDGEEFPEFASETPSLLYLFPLLDFRRSVIGVGVFLLDRRIVRTPELDTVLQKLESPINIIARNQAELYRQEWEKRRIYTLAVTDALTGLYNRRYLDEVSAIELPRARRYGYPLSFTYVDLDHFKRINDRYGHDVGDLVLRHFAKLLKETVRECDLIFRLGGEEFCILVPHTDREGARIMMERVRAQLRRTGGLEIGREKIAYTFSVGICDTRECGGDLESLMRCADGRLYQAKNSGRDRIVDAGECSDTSPV